MATFSIIYVVLIFACYSVPLCKSIKRKGNWLQISSLIFMAFYTAILVNSTVFPFYFDTNIFKPGSPSVSLIPFKSIFEMCQHISMRNAIRQLLGNIVLFVPLGFLTPIFSRKMRRPLATVILALSVSICIELVQLFTSLITGIPCRVVDIDDVILNTLGGIVGYFVYLLANKFIFSKFVSNKQ